jgi:hypothetical protein
MKIKHITQQTHDNADYTWGDFNREYKCSCFYCQPISCKIGQRDVGRIEDESNCCEPVFAIISGTDKRYKSQTRYCQCGLVCAGSCGKCYSVEFGIYPAHVDQYIPENKVGFIKKDPNFTQEFIGDADTYYIKFPLDATPEDKLLLIGMALMIDYSYFESKGK